VLAVDDRHRPVGSLEVIGQASVERSNAGLSAYRSQPQALQKWFATSFVFHRYTASLSA